MDTVQCPPEMPIKGMSLTTYRRELERQGAPQRGSQHTVTLRIKPTPSATVAHCELWLSNQGPQIVTGLTLTDATQFNAPPTPFPARPPTFSVSTRARQDSARPTLLVHGSSITHSVGVDSAMGGQLQGYPFGSGSAWSPSRTWPATAARLADVEFLSLGFNGQAVLDQSVARMIRDTPNLDCIALKLGINVHNSGCMGVRAFGQAVQGFLQTVRDGHPTTPLVLISPIFGSWREDVTYSEQHPVLQDRDDADPRFPTLKQMRTELQRIVGLLRARGDRQLHYTSGLELFSKTDYDAGLAPDGLHPNGDGYEVMGTRFAQLAFGDRGCLLPGRLRLHSKSKL